MIILLYSSPAKKYPINEKFVKIFTSWTAKKEGPFL
jgi:hypothetical protein